MWRGELAAARTVLTRMLQQADAQGVGVSYALQRLHLCELELRSGRWEAAAVLLDEWAQSAEGELLSLPMYERCRALLCAGRGDADTARDWAARAITRAEECGDGWDRLETQRARGTAALLDQNPAAAAADLRSVYEHTEREGVRGPGAFPVAPELVELAAAGMSNKEIARARSIAVHTAEAHLSRAYAKLGVRSRTQLAARRTPHRAE